MEYLIPIVFFTMILVAMAFQAGQWSKEFPTEEEMIKRIVDGRVRERIRKEVEADLADELNRQVARS